MKEPNAITAWFARWAVDVTWDRLPEQVRGMAKDELADLLGEMATWHALLGVPNWLAASHGVLAAIMAEGGLVGVRQPLLGEGGLDRVYLHGRLDPARVVSVSAGFEIARLSFKPYPSCRLTHPAVTVALALRKRIGAQFSAYWAISVALVHGKLSPAHLASEVPPSPPVARLIGAMRCDTVDSRTGGTRDIGSATLAAEGDFGRVTISASNAKGYPDDSLTREELAQKFAENLALAGVSAGEAARLAVGVPELDRAPDGAGLMRHFADACRSRR